MSPRNNSETEQMRLIKKYLKNDIFIYIYIHNIYIYIYIYIYISKRTNLLHNTPNQPPKFGKRNWVKINDDSHGLCDTGNLIRSND